MSIVLNNYLYFHGNAREAMEFYKSVFGGELTIQTNADVGMKDHPQWVMHARLEGGMITLLASDTEEASDEMKKVSLSLNGEAEDEDALRKVYEQLSEGGKVYRDGLKKEFWGDIFGSVMDKYGVEWQVNIAQPAQS